MKKGGIFLFIIIIFIFIFIFMNNSENNKNLGNYYYDPDITHHPLTLGRQHFKANFKSTFGSSPTNFIYKYNTNFMKYMTTSNVIDKTPGVNHIYTPPSQFNSPGLVQNKLPDYILNYPTPNNGNRASLMSKDYQTLLNNNKKTGALIPKTNIIANSPFREFRTPDRVLTGRGLNFDGTDLLDDQISVYNILIYLIYDVGGLYRYISGVNDTNYISAYGWFTDAAINVPLIMSDLCNTIRNNANISVLFYAQTIILYYFLCFGISLKTYLNTLFAQENITLDYIDNLVSDSNLENWLDITTLTGKPQEQVDVINTQACIKTGINFVYMMLLSFNMNICENNQPYGEGFQQFNYIETISSSKTFFTITNGSSDIRFSNSSGYNNPNKSSSSKYILNPGPDVNVFKNIAIVYNGMDDGSGDNNVVITMTGTDSSGNALSTYKNPVAFPPDRSNSNYIAWIIPLNYPVTVNSFTAALECNGKGCSIKNYFSLFVNN
jgi:hypothetical protein